MDDFIYHFQRIDTETSEILVQWTIDGAMLRELVSRLAVFATSEDASPLDTLKELAAVYEDVGREEVEAALGRALSAVGASRARQDKREADALDEMARDHIEGMKADSSRESTPAWTVFPGKGEDHDTGE